MVMVLVFFAVSILSSTAGSICGIGGGVIIKPVLDALGVMSVSSISFLSGCTVLAMSVVSVYKNLRSGTARMDLKIATSLAIGAAAGGVAGKSHVPVSEGSGGRREPGGDDPGAGADRHYPGHSFLYHI